MGAGLSQQPSQQQVRGRDLLGSRPEPVTSVGPGPGQRPLWEQSQARNILRSRPGSVTSTGAGPSHRSRSKLATSIGQDLVSDLCGSRPKTGTPPGTGPSQLPPLEQAQESDLYATRSEPATSFGADLNQ